VVSSAITDDEAFMRAAMVEAAFAAERGEVPVGSVAVYEGRVIGVGHNLRETARDPSAHAELIAMRAAAAYLGRWRLSGVTIFVTLEPCTMCAGALVNARVDRLVFGALDPKAGAVHSLYRIVEDVRLNHRMAVCAGILGEACAEQLKTFFAAVRAKR
jgi:tRNA(adenine34) deaminase